MCKNIFTTTIFIVKLERKHTIIYTCTNAYVYNVYICMHVCVCVCISLRKQNLLLL